MVPTVPEEEKLNGLSLNRLLACIGSRQGHEGDPQGEGEKAGAIQIHSRMLASPGRAAKRNSPDDRNLAHSPAS